MPLGQYKETVVGIVGPADLSLIVLQNKWDQIPEGNEYPIFSYYANYLIRQGIKVVLFTTSPDVKENVNYADDNIEILVAPKTGVLGRDTHSIFSLIRTRSVDVLYAQWTYEFAWGALMTGIKTIVTVHDNIDRIYKISPSKNKEAKAKLNDHIIRKADRLVTVSDYLFQHLPTIFRYKATTICNAYPEYLKNLTIPYDQRKPYFVSFINGFGKRTNAKRAIEAFKKFTENKSYQHIHYHLIGNGTEIDSDLYKYAKSINALNRIEFHGYLHHPQAMEYLRHATLLIHPSLEEANCISIIEALVLGIPVIGSEQSPGVIEQLDKGRGFLCNTGRSIDIYETVVACLKDPDLCVETTIRAQQDAIVRYRMENVLEAYASLCH